MTHPSLEPRSTSQGEVGVIELRLREPRQLFNSMDPSPFHERDLDGDAEEFIVGWATEFPSHVPLELKVHFDPAADRTLSDTVGDSVRHFFEYKAEVTLRRLRQELSRGRLSLMIGGLFLVLCLGGADLMVRLGEGPLFQILRESFIIVGWVAMWRPIDIFLYEWWPIRHEYRVYRRLGRAKVAIEFSPSPTVGGGSAGSRD